MSGAALAFLFVFLIHSAANAQKVVSGEGGKPGDIIRVDIGSKQGVRKGSVYTVHAYIPDLGETRRIARIVIENVEATGSTARITEISAKRMVSPGADVILEKEGPAISPPIQPTASADQTKQAPGKQAPLSGKTEEPDIRSKPLVAQMAVADELVRKDQCDAAIRLYDRLRAHPETKDSLKNESLLERTLQATKICRSKSEFKAERSRLRPDFNSKDIQLIVQKYRDLLPDDIQKLQAEADAREQTEQRQRQLLLDEFRAEIQKLRSNFTEADIGLIVQKFKGSLPEEIKKLQADAAANEQAARLRHQQLLDSYYAETAKLRPDFTPADIQPIVQKFLDRLPDEIKKLQADAAANEQAARLRHQQLLESYSAETSQLRPNFTPADIQPIVQKFKDRLPAEIKKLQADAAANEKSARDAEALRLKQLRDAYGLEVRKLRPGFTPSDIEQIVQQFKNSLPEEVKKLEAAAALNEKGAREAEANRLRQARDAFDAESKKLRPSFNRADIEPIVRKYQDSFPDEIKKLQATAAANEEALKKAAAPKPPPVAPKTFPTGSLPEYTLSLKDGVRFEFVPVEPGDFEMGSPNGKRDQRPLHKVSITKPFQIGKYEVTQEQWQSVLKENPSKWKDMQEPVENVKWRDISRFLAALNEMNDGFVYNLPTEAQWEYACRKGGGFDSNKSISDISVNKANSGGKHRKVSETMPNALGIHGMLGNVRELCQDKYFEDYYAKSPSTDPIADKGFATRRVSRGGSFFDDPTECQPTQRFDFSEAASAEYTGLRLTRVRK